ncbi:MAG: toll/interleukin-1 receptor domain-containing protein [Deltaproteobacteria bacterium]|nr:toll/interleukin-1 receptor domain-containing protein [Deltaproteobacteria bacterium]
MLQVFLGWSGDRSKAVADALHAWIPRVLQSVKPWFSEQDINAGTEWDNVLSEGINQSSIGILCITPECQVSPWLLFEAGVLAKKVDNEQLVIPYLIDMKKGDLKPPLSRFQMVEADEAGTFKMIESINKVLGKDQISDEILKETFSLFWKKLDNQLAQLSTPVVQSPRREPGEKIDELLELVRSATRYQSPSRQTLSDQDVRSIALAVINNLPSTNWSFPGTASSSVMGAPSHLPRTDSPITLEKPLSAIATSATATNVTQAHLT